jgi:hypothetical protein
MNSWTDAIWLFSEMNSQAEALTARARARRDTPMPAWITGHSLEHSRSAKKSHIAAASRHPAV